LILSVIPIILLNSGLLGAANQSSRVLIPHYEKSKKHYEDIFDYIDLEIPVGKIDESTSAKNILKIEGKGVFTSYLLTDKTSQFEFLKTYRHHLEKSDFEILFECDSGKDIRYSNCGAEMLKLVNSRRTFRGLYSNCADYKNTSLISAVLTRKDKRKTYLFMCSQDNKVFQSIIEEKSFDYSRLKINSQDYNPTKESLSGLIEQKKQDEKNSKDHSVISRYKGSYIRSYHVRDFVRAFLPIEAIKYSQIGIGERERLKLLPASGKGTFIEYRAEDGTSQYQIEKNYLQALKKNNFDILYHCSGEKDCGDGMNDYSPFARGSDDKNAWFSCRSSSTAVITARLKVTNNRNLYLFYCFESATWPRISQTVIEEKVIQTGLVTVTADEMKKSIESKGKISIYGIHFNTDSAKIKDESKMALSEIAKLLKSNPKLKLYVVGHTDSQGKEVYNQNLSQSRAQSVVKALTEQYGIAKNRLLARGVGALVPVSTNQANEGRQLNRRVELVEI